MPSDADLVSAVRYRLRDLKVKRTTAADVDFIVLKIHDLAPLADRLWVKTNEVSMRARRTVGRLLTERFGARNPRGGLLTIGVFLLTLSMTVPIASLTPRLRVPGGPELAANSAAILGVAAVIAAIVPFGKPVARNVFFQMQFIALVLVGSAAVGIALSGEVRITAVLGATASMAALLLIIIGRVRDRRATHDIDNALEIAHLDTAPEVALERERILSALAIELEASGADLDAMRTMRTAAITAFHAEGSPATDLDPTALPGAYIVQLQTITWLPAEWPPNRRRGANLSG